MQTRSALLLVEARTKRLLESLELSIPLGTFPVLSNAINHHQSSPMSVRREAPKETERQERDRRDRHQSLTGLRMRMSPDAPAIHPRFWLSIARHRPSSSFITFVMMNGYCSRQNHTSIVNRQSPVSITTTTITVIVETRERRRKWHEPEEDQESVDTCSCNARESTSTLRSTAS